MREVNEILAEIRSAKSLVRGFLWAVIVLSVCLIYALIHLDKYKERYAYLKAQYEAQKVELSEFRYTLTQVKADLKALEKHHERPDSEQRPAAPSPSR